MPLLPLPHLYTPIHPPSKPSTLPLLLILLPLFFHQSFLPPIISPKILLPILFIFLTP
ncbi:monovalent cation/H(+) antiporter subunit G, partial [Bacillus altitudinis]|uniref:monovalent cation/H(+) antiporter subunit G n=1 Tax=Bacillus altitudinis TaxID=293387 RepID=UPI001F4005CD